MDLSEYKRLLSQLPFGKRLPNALYIFWGEQTSLGEPLDRLISQTSLLCRPEHPYNIIKFWTDQLKMSFLAYPTFLEDPHPSLAHATTVDLSTGKWRTISYTKTPNPPILHRKETFIPKSHPNHSEFAALTRAEEDAGLYRETATIGFKLNWERLLASKQLRITNHTLQQADTQQRSPPPTEPTREIHRHKTAMTRYDLSKPVKTLLEYGLLKPTTSIFDYGCGQGSDVSGLRALGYEATGWDPVHRPDVAKREADVVNLGYVLNVIEDPAERVESLVDAYRHSKRLLVVSALIQETVDVNSANRLQDGIVTKRNTFQKFYDQQELQQFIEDALETVAMPVALGVFYVFRDPVEQQDFLIARSRRPIDWSQISARLGLGTPAKDRWEELYKANKELLDAFGALALTLGHFPEPTEFDREGEVVLKLGSLKRGLRAYVLGGGAPQLNWENIAKSFGIGQPPKARWQVLCEQHGELLDAFWHQTLQFGRLPVQVEFSQWSELCEKIGSAKKALRLFERRGGKEALANAADTRRNDLLFYVALANLRKRVPFGNLSPSLRLDIRTFFHDYTTALAKGLQLLYAAGDSNQIHQACKDLKIGWQDEQALYIHRSLLQQLPPVLRAYAGCAETLYGDANHADIIKLHKSSGKVTFLVYDDFSEKTLPELQLRIKVNLRTRLVQVFDHSQEGQLLFFKERFLPASHPNRHAMDVFSSKLSKLGISQTITRGPSKAEWVQMLERHGLNHQLNKVH